MRDKRRGPVREIVHKAICPDPASYEEFKEGYKEAFSRYRVLAAYKGNSASPSGGVAFYEVPQDKPEALYVGILVGQLCTFLFERSNFS